MHQLLAVARYMVFTAFALSVGVALASWILRTKRVSPFGALGRSLRAVSDPLLSPVERRLVRSGGNPVHAGWWLVVSVTVAGVLFLWLLDWAIGTSHWMIGAATAGPRGLFHFIVVLAYDVLFAALMLRVIASWFGVFRYSRWMRPAYVLTDWLVEPIRRLLPPMGAIDWSPLVAWLALWVLKQLLLSVV